MRAFHHLLAIGNGLLLRQPWLSGLLQAPQVYRLHGVSEELRKFLALLGCALPPVRRQSAPRDFLPIKSGIRNIAQAGQTLLTMSYPLQAGIHEYLEDAVGGLPDELRRCTTHGQARGGQPDDTQEYTQQPWHYTLHTHAPHYTSPCDNRP